MKEESCNKQENWLDVMTQLLRNNGVYVVIWSLSHVCLMRCSLPGSSVLGIPQSRTLEWIAISFSNAGKWKVKVKSLSHVRLLTTPWTAAYQAHPSIGFSRQEYWSGVPLPYLAPKLSLFPVFHLCHPIQLSWTFLNSLSGHLLNF